MSDPDATLEDMVAAASIPNLSTLYRRAKDKGHLPPVYEYGGGRSKFAADPAFNSAGLTYSHLNQSTGHVTTSTNP